jgi:hypothetical protein
LVFAEIFGQIISFGNHHEAEAQSLLRYHWFLGGGIVGLITHLSHKNGHELEGGGFELVFFQSCFIKSFNQNSLNVSSHVSVLDEQFIIPVDSQELIENLENIGLCLNVFNQFLE